MESLVALWIAVTLLAAVSVLDGLTLANCALICAAMGFLGAVFYRHRPTVQHTDIASRATGPMGVPPLRLVQGSTNAFGDVDPDLLQVTLLRKMSELERVAVQNRQQG